MYTIRKHPLSSSSGVRSLLGSHIVNVKLFSLYYITVTRKTQNISKQNKNSRISLVNNTERVLKNTWVLRFVFKISVKRAKI